MIGPRGMCGLMHKENGKKPITIIENANKEKEFVKSDNEDTNEDKGNIDIKDNEREY